MIKELIKAFYDIPFENSDFQNKAFVMAAQQTPGRAYRAIGLRMFAKLRAINELKYARQLQDVDIAEKQAVINDPNSTTFARQRAMIEIEKILSVRDWEDKLLNDAIRELNCLYAEFEKFPKYTREQFELEEREHFEKRLEQQIESRGNGSVESLLAMEHSLQFDKILESTKKELLEHSNEF